MLRIFLIALALTVLLPVPGKAADSTTVANSSEPLNIGFVLYTKTRTPGVLSARWNYVPRDNQGESQRQSG